MNIINILISLTILLIGLLILNIELQHCLVILIITTLILFIMSVLQHRNKENSLNIVDRNLNKVDFYKDNINRNNNGMLNNTNLNNDSMLNNTNLNNDSMLNNTNLNNDSMLNNTNINEDNYIIHPSMYNQDDCTTDMSCIQKPNVINLFPGFDKEMKKALNNTKRVDNIVVENFVASTNPFQLNDVSIPFNSTVINPFVYYSNVKNEEIQNNELEEAEDDLCFHCRKGYCVGDVCKNTYEINKCDIINNKKNVQKTHPYSDDSPVIRVTNPDLAL